MQSTRGMVRTIDNLGRMVVPREMFRMLDIELGDKVEIWVGQDEQGVPSIFLRKYIPGCIFCDESIANQPIIEYRGRRVCQSCAEKLQKQEITEVPKELPN